MFDFQDVVVIWNVYEDGWCEGYCRKRKKSGMFPLNCIRLTASELNRRSNNSSGSNSGTLLRNGNVRSFSLQVTNGNINTSLKSSSSNLSTES